MRDESLSAHPPIDDVADALRRHGLRVTAPRIAAYGAVAALPGHPDVESVSAEVRDQLDSVSTQAVYDGLSALTAVGLLRRIEPAGSPARIDCLAGAAPCLSPDQTGGFAIDEAEITFWGICPNCQTSKEETIK